MTTPTQNLLTDQIAKCLSQIRQAQYWLANDRNPPSMAEAKSLIGELQAELNRLMTVATDHKAV